MGACERWALDALEGAPRHTEAETLHFPGEFVDTWVRALVFLPFLTIEEPFGYFK